MKFDTMMKKESRFHPDHVWGLMEKGTNAAVFPNAELIVNGAEYKWWTEPGRVEKLAEGRRAAGKRIADVFPTWKNWRLVEDNAGVAPGVRLLAAVGHTPDCSLSTAKAGADTSAGARPRLNAHWQMVTGEESLACTHVGQHEGPHHYDVLLADIVDIIFSGRPATRWTGAITTSRAKRLLASLPTFLRGVEAG